MQKSLRLWISIFIVLTAATGCRTTNVVGKAISPKHSEVLIYDLSYDLTYLRTVEALQTVKDWEIRSTEKEKGIIRCYNQAYKRFEDSDLRQITFLVNRVSRNQTSVQIHPDDQHVQGGGALLEKVASVLNAAY